MTEEYWVAVLEQEDRLISNSDRKFRYHCYSLESMSEELVFQERTVYIQENVIFVLWSMIFWTLFITSIYRLLWPV